MGKTFSSAIFCMQTRLAESNNVDFGLGKPGVQKMGQKVTNLKK